MLISQQIELSLSVCLSFMATVQKRIRFQTVNNQLHALNLILVFTCFHKITCSRHKQGTEMKDLIESNANDASPGH